MESARKLNSPRHIGEQIKLSVNSRLLKLKATIYDVLDIPLERPEVDFKHFEPGEHRLASFNNLPEIDVVIKHKHTRIVFFKDGSSKFIDIDQ